MTWEAAKARGDGQYFVGLMVFMPSTDNEQIVLDGQQRLASAVIFFSAVRNWLRQYGDFEKDANQIQDWFIGRSELGERELRPRLILNAANHQAFLDYIVKPVPIGDIRAAHASLKRYDRNRRLIEAAIYCHDRISALSGRNTPANTAALLIGIVIYLRDAVGVVRLNVSNEDTAFTIF
jgi:hypothetical protein